MRSWWRWRRRGADEATCAEVAQVLQHYLDGEVDEVTARRVGRHLEACVRCGLETETYLAIKHALARQQPTLDPESLSRLRAFADRLVDEAPGGAGSTA